jgi:hypothetical protein
MRNLFFLLAVFISLPLARADAGEANLSFLLRLASKYFLKKKRKKRKEKKEKKERKRQRTTQTEHHREYLSGRFDEIGYLDD